MTAPTAGNVRVDKPLAAGAAFLAPQGTALPTDNTTALDVAFKGVGYLDPAGITETPTRQVTPIYAYGGDEVASAESQDSLTVGFTMIETNEVSLGAYWGSSNVSTALGITTATADSSEFEHQVLVIETISNGKRSRRVYPDAKVTERGANVSADGAARAYPVTFTCYPDASGKKRYEYEGTAA